MLSVGLESTWLLVALPLFAFTLIVFAGRWLPRQGAFLGVLATGVGLALLALLAAAFQRGGEGAFSVDWLRWAGFAIPLGMHVDALALVMLGIVTSVSFLVQVYSLGYMATESRYGWFFAVVSLFAAAMLGLVLADNFLVLYVTWELVGLCSYLLIGYWYERPAAAAAAKKAFITTRVGDLGLLIGILLLFRATDTFSMSETFDLAQRGDIAQPLLTVIALLVLAGAVGKSAQFPLHVWLPDAMEGPTPVSALIHAATMVAAGVYLVARALPLFEAAPLALFVVAILGLVSALLAGALAVVERDMKRVLAYSTISQLGFMFMGLGSLGYSGAVFHLFTHAYFKALLFLAAGSVLHSLATQDIAQMGGLLRRMPWTGATFLIGALALAGVPPLAGFWSKDDVLHAVLTYQSPAFGLLALVATALTGLYVARVVLLAFFGGPRSEAAQHAHESPAILIGPLVVLAVGAAFAGLLAPLGVVRALLDPGHPYTFDPGLAVLSTLAAVVGLGIGWAVYGARLLDAGAIASRFGSLYGLATNKFYLDALYQAMVDRVVLTLARFVALFDRRVVNEVGVDGAGVVTVAAGERLRYLETGKLYHYALLMALGVMGITLIVLLIG